MIKAALNTALILSIIALPSCVTNSPSDSALDTPVTIEVGTLAAAPGSSRWLNREIDAFEKAHPNITVNRAPFSDLYDREANPLHKNPPMAANVIGIDSHNGYETAYLAENDLIVPLNKLFRDKDFDKNAYYGNYWDAVTYQRKIWGVPWHVRSDHMLLNWKMFEEAGITEPPATWDELVDAAQRLTRDTNNDGIIDQFGVAVRTNDDTIPDMYVSLLYQLGGHLMKNGEMDLSKAESNKANEILQRFGPNSDYGRVDRASLRSIRQGSYPDPKGSRHEIRGNIRLSSGFQPLARSKPVKTHYAIHFVQNEQSQYFLGLEGFRLAPIPVQGKDRTFASRRLYFAIRKSTPSQEAASWKFIKWMSRKDISLPDNLVGFPCRKDIIEHPDFLKVAANEPVQNLEVLFTAGRNGVDLPYQIIGRLEAMQVLWRTFFPALEDPKMHDRLVKLASKRANAQLEPMIRR